MTYDTGDEAAQTSQASEMTHHFMYPKVTPVRPGAGGPGTGAPGDAKVAAPGPSAGVRRAA